MRNIVNVLALILVLFSSISFAFAYDLDDKLDIDFRKAVEAGCPEIKIKDPGAAAAFAFLPGGGSFYTGQIGLGVLNLLLWPFSVLWDAPASATRAIKKNKLATVEMCKDEDKLSKEAGT